MTENITLEFGAVSLRHLEVSVETGAIVKDSKGFWDDEKQQGLRQGTQVVFFSGSLDPTGVHFFFASVYENSYHVFFSRRKLHSSSPPNPL